VAGFSFRLKSLVVLLVSATLFQSGVLSGERIAVRHTEGLVHGFLALRTLDGETLASGDMMQVARGDRVTNHLIFRFKDGSINDETAVFSQHGSFRLISDHLIQSGPTFPHPMDVTTDVSTGQITVHYTDDGNEKVTTDHLKLPADLANGLVVILLKNMQPDAPETKVSLLAATPKPVLVKLAISSQGEEPFSLAGSAHKATHYVVKVEIGGVTGIMAQLLGKKPPDTHVWIQRGEAPTFVKSEGPLYNGGPIWRIEWTSPVWPRDSADDPKKEPDKAKHPSRNPAPNPETYC
jgi:hypothetical protein